MGSLIEKHERIVVWGLSGADSVKVQEALFSDGWTWLSGSKEVQFRNQPTNLIIPEVGHGKRFARTFYPERYGYTLISAEEFLDRLRPRAQQLTFDFGEKE